MQFGGAICLAFSLSRNKMRRLFRINIENNFDSHYALIKQDYNFYHCVLMISHRVRESITYVANDKLLNLNFFLRSRDMKMAKMTSFIELIKFFYRKSFFFWRGEINVSFCYIAYYEDFLINE